MTTVEQQEIQEMSEGQEKDGVKNEEEVNHRMSQGFTPGWQGPRLGQADGQKVHQFIRASVEEEVPTQEEGRMLLGFRMSGQKRTQAPSSRSASIDPFRHSWVTQVQTLQIRPRLEIQRDLTPTTRPDPADSLPAAAAVATAGARDRCQAPACFSCSVIWCRTQGEPDSERWRESGGGQYQHAGSHVVHF